MPYGHKARTPTLIATALGLMLASVAAGEGPDGPWPHLTPEGFGLKLVGRKDLNHAPWRYRPREIPGTASHLQVRFLPAERTGERIDVWVPASAQAGAKLPCVVLFYGGGWGGKVAGGLHGYARDLVARGYVVAMPDYVLKAAQPVPAAVWDGAAAIRWLRANAETYRIDPERIGVWGFSAGGWLVQYLTPSDTTTLYRVTIEKNRKKTHFPAPLLDPRPALPDQPLRVQGVVSDWGCQRLAERRVHDLNTRWLGPDDPPLLTCHNVQDVVPAGPALYRKAGAVAEVIHLETRNTHVPSGKTPGLDLAGKPTTWQEQIYRFLDEYVKRPKRATAPEATPAGGAVAGPVKVRLRTVHAAGRIHYTIDGSKPTATSPVYAAPLTVRPGRALQAIAVKPGLPPSAVATFVFTKATRLPPRITTTKRHFTAKVGRPFKAAFAAEGEGIQWYVHGRTGNVIDGKRNPPRIKTWLEIDRETGLLSGTPEAPGYLVVLVTAVVADGERRLCDSRQIVVTVRGR